MAVPIKAMTREMSLLDEVGHKGREVDAVR
jgi:hypothetical protein